MQQNQPQSPQQPRNITRLWRSGPAGKCGVIVGGIIIFLVLATCIGVTNDLLHGSQPTTTHHQSGSSTATTATHAPQVVHYPPKTLSDLRGLAAKGYADAIHTFKSDDTGIPSCQQPRREVTVDPRVTGQQLAEDLLAYFYGGQLDSPCGSIIFAYHNQSEGNDAFTAGRVDLTVYDASGSVNIDPNATNLKYMLTLDTGDVTSGQDYIINY